MKENPSDDWQLTMKKMNERLHHVLTSKQLSDCAFTVGTDSYMLFNAHKLLLAMSSPVFQAMFYGGMAEKENPIRIFDIEPEAFQAVLEYIYTDNTEIETFDLACAVWYTAKKYMLPGLVEKCKQKIFHDLSTENACQAYEFSKLHDEPELTERSLQLMMSNTEAVVANPRFEDVELATLLLVLDTPCISSEEVLFDAVLKWARKECARKGIPEYSANLRHVVGPALEKIHFLALTRFQFAGGPAKAPLFTKNEILAIIMKLSNPSLPMPPGFSTALCRCRMTNYCQGRCMHIFEIECDKFISLEAASISTLCFSVDEDITIVGLTVHTPRRIDGKRLVYNEMYNIFMRQGRLFRLVGANSCQPVKKSRVKIDFSTSFVVKKTEICFIDVKLAYQGLYPCRSNKQKLSVECDGVTLNGCAEMWSVPSVLSEIFFHRST